MTQDLKEMLHCIEMNCKHNKCFGGIKLDEEDCKLLLDYITNLQQENERLKEKLENKLTPEELVNMLNQELVRHNKCYKSRCDKAIEYIMSNLITEWDIKNDGCVSGSDLPADAITPILNILNGSDENE